MSIPKMATSVSACIAENHTFLNKQSSSTRPHNGRVHKFRACYRTVTSPRMRVSYILSAQLRWYL